MFLVVYCPLAPQGCSHSALLVAPSYAVNILETQPVEILDQGQPHSPSRRRNNNIHLLNRLVGSLLVASNAERHDLFLDGVVGSEASGSEYGQELILLSLQVLIATHITIGSFLMLLCSPTKYSDHSNIPTTQSPTSKLAFFPFCPTTTFTAFPIPNPGIDDPGCTGSKYDFAPEIQVLRRGSVLTQKTLMSAVPGWRDD